MVNPLRKSLSSPETKTASENEGEGSVLRRRSLPSSSSSISSSGKKIRERTVKQLSMGKAITLRESTPLYEACRIMAEYRVDALLLSNSNTFLCGILTDRDIATRVIAKELNLKETPVSEVMTKEVFYVSSDTMAVEALQEMVQRKFRHLPVVEKKEVITLLDIAKCLYDAITRMEKSAENGKAITAAVQKQNTCMERLRERISTPSISTIIQDFEKHRVLKVELHETVLAVTKKMLDCQSSAAMVMVENKLVGILTSKDVLMRVIVKNLPPETTTVEKVMTHNPRSATVDMAIVDALRIMENRKFLHLPVLDKDGDIVAVIDVLDITRAAVTTVHDVEVSVLLPPPISENDPSRFAFKIQDKTGQMHKFVCETESLATLITAILQRIGDDVEPDNFPHIEYEDEDNTKVVLASDDDLKAAVVYAKSIGLESLELHLEHTKEGGGGVGSNQSNSRGAGYTAGAAFAAAAFAVLLYHRSRPG